MNPWYTVGALGLVSAPETGHQGLWLMKHTDVGFVTKFSLMLLTLICRLSLNILDRDVLFVIFYFRNTLTFLHSRIRLKLKSDDTLIT